MTELEEMRLLMRKAALAAALASSGPNGCADATNLALELAGLKVRVYDAMNVSDGVAMIRTEAKQAGLLDSDLYSSVKAALAGSNARSRDAILIGPQRCGKTSHWAPQLKALGYRDVHETNDCGKLCMTPLSGGKDVFFCDEHAMVKAGKGYL